MQMVKHHYIMVGTDGFHYRNETFFYTEGYFFLILNFFFNFEIIEFS